MAQIEISRSDERNPVSQTCGTTIAVIFAAIYGLFTIFRIVNAFGSHGWFMICFQLLIAMSNSFYLYFYVEAVRVPDFLAGKPSLKKFIFPFGNLFLNFVRIILINFVIQLPPDINYSLPGDIFVELFLFFLCIAMYNHDDSKGSCFLCFKPWIYKEVQLKYTEQKHLSITQPQSQPQFQPQFQPQYLNYPTRPYPYPGYNTSAIVQ